MLDSSFSVHEIPDLRAQTAANRRNFRALSVPILLPAELRQNLAVFVAQLDAPEQVGTVLEGLSESHAAAPAPDSVVVSASEDFGDRHAHKFCRACVVRVVEQAAGAVGRARRAVVCCFAVAGVVGAKALRTRGVRVAE